MRTELTIEMTVERGEATCDLTITAELDSMAARTYGPPEDCDPGFFDLNILSIEVYLDEVEKWAPWAGVLTSAEEAQLDERALDALYDEHERADEARADRHGRGW